MSLHGKIEDQADSEGLFTTMDMHVSLDVTKLAGTWSVEYNTVGSDSTWGAVEALDWGVAKGVACVAPTKEEKREDKAMKEAFTRWRSLRPFSTITPMPPVGTVTPPVGVGAPRDGNEYPQ